MRWLCCISVAFVCVCGCDNAFAPVQVAIPEEHGQISGRVLNAKTNAGVPNVKVEAAGIGAFSDASGYYRLLNTPVGSIDIAATKAGYQDYSGVVSVESGTTAHHDIPLTPSSAP